MCMCTSISKHELNAPKYSLQKPNRGDTAEPQRHTVKRGLVIISCQRDVGDWIAMFGNRKTTALSADGMLAVRADSADSCKSQKAGSGKQLEKGASVPLPFL